MIGSSDYALLLRGRHGVTWLDAGGANTSSIGPVETKTGADGWNACAQTAQRLTGDGWMTFLVTTVTAYQMVGVAVTPSAAGAAYASLDLAIYNNPPDPPGPYQVYALGVPLLASSLIPAVGDRCRAGVLGGVLVAQVSQDGGATWTTLYTGGAPPGKVRGAVAAYTMGATVTALPYVGQWG